MSCFPAAKIKLALVSGVKMQYFSVLYVLLSVALYKAVKAATPCTSPPPGSLVVSKTPSYGQYLTVSIYLGSGLGCTCVLRPYRFKRP